MERWKDGWNGEVEGAVRWCQRFDWRGVREGVEGRARGCEGGGEKGLNGDFMRDVEGG